MRCAKFFSLAIFCMAIVGCSTMTPEQIALKSDLDLCRGYRGAMRVQGETAAAYKLEMQRRNLLTQEEWDLAAKKQISMGISQCALYAAWGVPGRENRSVGSWGVNIQHVFNVGYPYVPASYVYTRNGKVTSWQN